MSSPTTALTIPEKGPAIARIVNDVLDIAAGLLPSKIGRHKLSPAKRRALIEQHLVMSPTSAGTPFICTASFGAKRRRVGTTLAQLFDKDQPLFNDVGLPVMDFAPDFDLDITATVELPDLKDGGKRTKKTVQPLVLCTGRRGLVPYVLVDEKTGQLRAGPLMHCMFIRDFDPKTGKESGRIFALPLGLADGSNISTYNNIVSLLAAQGSSKAWERIEEIPNNLTRDIQYLVLRPRGPAATGGLSPVWKSWSFDDLDPSKEDFWIVGRVGGKTAVLARDSQRQCIVRDREVPEQVFRIKQMWNRIELTVWGLEAEIGEMAQRELDQGELNVYWLMVFGSSLYAVTPRSGAKLLRQALKNPPIEAMISVGLLSPGATAETAKQTLNGFAPKIRLDVETTVTQARDDLVHNLGAGGQHGLHLSLQDMLGGEPSGELLKQVLDCPDPDGLLVTGILTSRTAGDLGLEVWDPRCWVLIETYKALLLEKAQAEGVELPLPPDVEDEPASIADKDTNGASGSAIEWHEGMNVSQLRTLAKGLEGVTSRSRKAELIAALQGVCPPTPPPAS